MGSKTRVVPTLSVVLGCVVFGGLAASGAMPAASTDTKLIEDAVLTVNAEMSQAGEAVDMDRLFSFMLDTDKGSIIQNGVLMATRQEALATVKANLRDVHKIQYRWKNRYVTVLSPEVAVLTAEGESTATTSAGEVITTPFAQTAVFVLRDGHWKAIHAHQSTARAR